MPFTREELAAVSWMPPHLKDEVNSPMNWLVGHLWKSDMSEAATLQSETFAPVSKDRPLESRGLASRLLALERLLNEIKDEIGAVHARLDRLDRALAAWREKP
jgi:hypothetical protein